MVWVTLRYGYFGSFERGFRVQSLDLSQDLGQAGEI